MRPIDTMPKEGRVLVNWDGVYCIAHAREDGVLVEGYVYPRPRDAFRGWEPIPEEGRVSADCRWCGDTGTVPGPPDPCPRCSAPQDSGAETHPSTAEVAELVALVTPATPALALELLTGLQRGRWSTIYGQGNTYECMACHCHVRPVDGECVVINMGEGAFLCEGCARLVAEIVGETDREPDPSRE